MNNHKGVQPKLMTGLPITDAPTGGKREIELIPIQVILDRFDAVLTTLETQNKLLNEVVASMRNVADVLRDAR